MSPFLIEAAECRMLAQEFSGKAEGPVLQSIAAEFDRLAAHDLANYAEDQCYYLKRAQDETMAAVAAKHPRARMAHLSMARRYDALSRAVAH